MTNLSPGPSQRRITRDLILVSVPLLLGGVVSAGLWWWQLRPVQQRVEALEVRRDDLTAQQRRLPALHRRVKEARKELARTEQQQVVLLDLIAGRDRVQTFLAMLDQLARTTGVAIQRFEPLSVTRPPACSGSSWEQSQAQEYATSSVGPLPEVGLPQNLRGAEPQRNLCRGPVVPAADGEPGAGC